MQKLTDKELKREFESPRGQLRFALRGVVLLTVGAGVLLMLLFDPLGWLDGPRAVHEAKKWLALCVCFIWLPVLAGIWFMVIRPLQTGIVVTGGSKSRAPHVVLRSEEPARFRANIWWNCVLLVAGLVFATFMLVSFLRDLQKAKAASFNSAAAANGAMA